MDICGKQKKILILLSTYNGEKFLHEQLESLYLQKNVEISVLIRDDGSQDSTCEIINRWKGKIRLELCRELNIGSANSFMRLIKLASDNYDYYAFCDQDDWWKENKLDVAVSKLKLDQPGLYYCELQRVGESLERIPDHFKKSYHTEELKSAMVVTSAAGCSMVFNRKLMEMLKRYTPQTFYMHDEWVLRVCAAVGGRVIYDPGKYILYRQHGNNTVSGIDKMKYGPVRMFFYRYKKFFDFSYSPYITALELKNGYYDLMDNTNREVVDLLIKSKNSWKARYGLIFHRKIYTPYTIYNLKFLVQILMDRL